MEKPLMYNRKTVGCSDVNLWSSRLKAEHWKGANSVPTKYQSVLTVYFANGGVLCCHLQPSRTVSIWLNTGT